MEAALDSRGRKIPEGFGSEEARRRAVETRKKLHQREKASSPERKKIIEETTDRIRGLLAFHDVPYKELAKRLDMTPAHVSHLMKGNRNMTLGTLADIGEAVGYRFTIIPSPIEDDE